jgi:hypothetical protein
MKRNKIISRVLKSAATAAPVFLTKTADGFAWSENRRAAFVVVPDTATAAVVADWLFWDYDTDYIYKNLDTTRRPC